MDNNRESFRTATVIHLVWLADLRLGRPATTDEGSEPRWATGEMRGSWTPVRRVVCDHVTLVAAGEGIITDITRERWTDTNENLRVGEGPAQIDRPLEGWPDSRFRGLAEYKMELGRGLVHTTGYAAKMRTLQLQYDSLRQAWPVENVDAWFTAWKFENGTST